MARRLFRCRVAGNRAGIARLDGVRSSAGLHRRNPATNGCRADTINLLRLCRNRSYVGTVLGSAAYTFAFGGLSFWMPTYLKKFDGLISLPQMPSLEA